MGQKEKLILKLKSNPKTFTFDDAEALLGYFTYRRSNKGRTSGPGSCLQAMSIRPRFCCISRIQERNSLSIR